MRAARALDSEYRRNQDHCRGSHPRQSDSGFCCCPRLGSLDAEPDAGNGLQVVYQEAPRKNPCGQGRVVEKVGDWSQGGLTGEVLLQPGPAGSLWAQNASGVCPALRHGDGPLSTPPHWTRAPEGCVTPSHFQGRGLPPLQGSPQRSPCEFSINTRQLGEGHPKLKRHFRDLSGPPTVSPLYFLHSYLPTCLASAELDSRS